MANRNFSDVQALARKTIILAGKISLSALGAVTATDSVGAFTVAKSGTGEYTLTLADEYQKLLGASVILGGNTTDDLVPNLGAVDVASAKTIEVLLLDAGAATDVTAATDVYVTLVLSNSSVN
jgi:hypothetical protein